MLPAKAAPLYEVRKVIQYFYHRVKFCRFVWENNSRLKLPIQTKLSIINKQRLKFGTYIIYIRISIIISLIVVAL